jgi:hypothetical protein
MFLTFPFIDQAIALKTPGRGMMRWDEKVDPRSRIALSYR